MLPALRPGDLLWVRHGTEPRRGDIVLVKHTAAPQGLFLKRLVGLPGEHLEIRSNKVFINDRPLPEPYVPESASIEPKLNSAFDLPNSAFAVLGDTRDDSLDSRQFGPVPREEIVGAASRIVWPPWRWRSLIQASFVLLVALRVMAAPSEIGEKRILAFADQNNLKMFIGKYDPHSSDLIRGSPGAVGWVQPDDFYEPPEPGSLVSLFGLHGKIGEVRVADPQRAFPDDVPAGWSATVTRWNWAVQPQALAIFGSISAPEMRLRDIPLDDPSVRAAAAAYLNSKGLSVPEPWVTQAFQTDITGDGLAETFFCVHSDESALKDDEAASIYAVAFVRVMVGQDEKLIPVASQTSYKPAHRTVAEHKIFYGSRDYYRFITFMDIDGDGRQEMVLYRAKSDATQVDVVALDGATVKTVLTAYRAFR
jgi:signal peptidase I